MRRPELNQMSPEEIQREVAEILAAGYLRLCADAAEGGAQGEASQRRSGAPEGQECAPATAEEGP